MRNNGSNEREANQDDSGCHRSQSMVRTDGVQPPLLITGWGRYGRYLPARFVGRLRPGFVGRFSRGLSRRLSRGSSRGLPGGLSDGPLRGPLCGPRRGRSDRSRCGLDGSRSGSDGTRGGRSLRSGGGPRSGCAEDTRQQHVFDDLDVPVAGFHVGLDDAGLRAEEYDRPSPANEVKERSCDEKNRVPLWYLRSPLSLQVLEANE
mmetsp:Transcript_5881/g.14648  ORF Transcript_5881/g.14648 Transcript_5881/m.14648 type:complete len:205 (+) Transcript_5881:742-1356(+)